MHSLELSNGLDGINAYGKQDQDTIAQILHHVTMVGLADLAYPLRQTGDSLGCLGVAQRLKDACTSCEVGKNDGNFCHKGIAVTCGYLFQLKHNTHRTSFTDDVQCRAVPACLGDTGLVRLARGHKPAQPA